MGSRESGGDLCNVQRLVAEDGRGGHRTSRYLLPVHIAYSLMENDTSAMRLLHPSRVPKRFGEVLGGTVE